MAKMQRLNLPARGTAICLRNSRVPTQLQDLVQDFQDSSYRLWHIE